MGAADKTSLMYAMHRAYFPAFTARYTLVVIYSRKIIYYLYCLGRTGALALSAGYAAVLAELANLCSLVVIVAFNYYTSNVVYKMNYSVRTGALAKTAADTLFRVYFGYTSLGYSYRITGTYVCAVTVSKTGKGAEPVARKVHIRSLAGCGTAVNIFSFVGTASAVAGNVRNPLHNVLGLNT